MKVLHGNGSDLSNCKAVQRRVKCKLITQTIMLALIDIAKEKGAASRVKAYWNTHHCQNEIITVNNKMYAPHCKNQFCTYCCGIRKAELIGKYLPVLQSWQECYFVTLTVKAVPAHQLPKTIKKLHENFRLIVDKYRKRGQRDTGEKFMGIKTMECNFNATFRTYNPHLHLIVPSKEIAETLINEWLAIWGKRQTHRDAQHYRKVENRERDLKEIIKYEAKIIPEPGTKKQSSKKGSAKIYPRLWTTSIRL